MLLLPGNDQATPPSISSFPWDCEGWGRGRYGSGYESRYHQNALMCCNTVDRDESQASCIVTANGFHKTVLCLS